MNLVRARWALFATPMMWDKPHPGVPLDALSYCRARCLAVKRLRAALVALLLLFTTWASAVKLDAEDQRKFGTPYLTNAQIFVTAKPNDKARIVADIARGRLIYVKKTSDPAWLEVTAMGSILFPNIYLRELDKKLDLINGKLELESEYTHRNYSERTFGYVRVEKLKAYANHDEFPVKLDQVQTLPSLWADLGATENRFVPKDPSAAPFSTAVLLALDFGAGIAINVCSGFFVESQLLVGTAGHCLDDSIMTEARKEADRFARERGIVLTKRANPEILVLILDYNTLKREVIPATLIGLQNVYEHPRKDWALLKLSRKPLRNVLPLGLPTPGSWQNLAQVRALSLGFPGDLYALNMKRFGDHIVVGSWCDVPVKNFEYIDDQLTGQALHTNSRGLGCVTYKGNSGGPLIIYNKDTARFELAGIISFVRGEQTFVSEDKLSEPAREKYLKRRDSLIRELGPYSEMPHGAASLQHQLLVTTRQAVAEAHWILDGAFIDQVLRQLQLQKSSKDILSTLNDGFGPPTPNEWAKLPNWSWHLDGKADTTLKLRASISLLSRLTDLDVRYQQKIGVGDLLDVDKLTSDGVPHSKYWIAGVFKRLVADKNMGKYREDLSRFIATSPDPEKVDRGKRQLEILDKLPVVLVGGDLYQLHFESKHVLSIARNFASVVDGEIAEILLHPSLSRFLPPKTPTEKQEPNQSLVEPTIELRRNNFGALTPVSVPGATVIAPIAAWTLLTEGAFKASAERPIFLSAYEENLGLPTAINVSFASQGGNYQDDIQMQLRSVLAKLTTDKRRPIVTFCHNSNCWLSYNLTLRLVQLGYSNVFWMRSGFEGWINAMLPTGYVSRPDQVNR